MGLLNFEIRIPFIDELRFGWPFPWAISGIRGIVFSDFGTVWSEALHGDNPYRVFRKENTIAIALMMSKVLLELDCDYSLGSSLLILMWHVEQTLLT